MTARSCGKWVDFSNPFLVRGINNSASTPRGTTLFPLAHVGLVIPLPFSVQRRFAQEEYPRKKSHRRPNSSRIAPLSGKPSRAMDLRGLFTEMCDAASKRSSGGGGGGGGHNKETLSSSGLARGLKHAGLPLDRALVNLLVAAFSTSGSGQDRDRGLKHHYALSYADFHRMVHCDGLLSGGFGAQSTGGGAAETLDEQVHRKRAPVERTMGW